MNEIAPLRPSRGEVMTGPLAPVAPFGDSATRLHRQLYDDYEVARAHMFQALGDISECEIWGREVLVGVFCRPNTITVQKPDGTKAAIYTPVKDIKEDWWQGKVAMILKCGPEAFKGDGSYMHARFGGNPAETYEAWCDANPNLWPKVGDWVWVRADAGTQLSVRGENASRPRGVDQRGEPFDIFEWDGWPCRVVGDEHFFGRVTLPHQVV